MSVIVLTLLYLAMLVIGVLTGILVTILVFAACGVGAMLVAARIPDAQADLTDDTGLDLFDEVKHVSSH